MAGQKFSKSYVSDFVHTLDEVISNSNSKNDDGIIKYALRKIDDGKIWNLYWESLEPFLIRCCISFPHSWDYVAQVVAWRYFTDGVDKNLWRTVIEKSLAQNVRSGHDFEVVWALWLARQLKIDINKDIFNAVFDKCGPFSMIQALDLHQASNMTSKLPKDKILERIGDKPMLGQNWLFAFEADRQFDLKIKTKNLQGHEFFKTLYDDNVSFFDSEFELAGDDGLPAHPEKAIKGSSSYEDLIDPDDTDDADDDY